MWPNQRAVVGTVLWALHMKRPCSGKKLGLYEQKGSQCGSSVACNGNKGDIRLNRRSGKHHIVQGIV